MSDLDERIDNASDGAEDDLFGDDGGDDASQIEDNPPIPSDDDLASDHDRARSATRDFRDDRSQVEASAEPEPGNREKKVVEELLQRHGLPKTKDGNMQLAKVPNFLRFIPEVLDSDDFAPSAWDVENSKRRIPMNIVRYRRNPKTGKLESNANIYRWSDGSLTLQVGEEHYDIQVKSQIPPTNKAYQPDRDANRYIAAAHSAQAQLLTVAHVTEEWAIRPDKQRVDEDTELLREKMGLAKGGVKEGEMIITTNQDPELQKRQAELAEKERTRAARKRENAQMRMEGGAAAYRKTGLSIGELEVGRRSGSGRKRGPGGSSKRSRAHNDEYDSDDDPGVHRHNEYDKDDGFIADSDEESMEGGDDEEDDILDDDEEEYERPRAKRQRTEEPNEDADADADADADGEPDDDAPATSGDHGRRRVRRVVSDDDDD